MIDKKKSIEIKEYIDNNSNNNITIVEDTEEQVDNKHAQKEDNSNSKDTETTEDKARKQES